MFLDYLALVILVMGLLVTFYGFIYVHDIPYKIAKKREHPYAEAIHVGGWLSLFTLHAIWPFIWIWAVSYRKPGEVPADPAAGDLSSRLAGIEARLKQLESAHSDGHTGGRIHA
ncbi:MAG TPA: DUF3302 domain-containing protein [Fimbriiglobus sp.]|jgi:hypothetical protein|nr:DUF3302 domain-containing protein [Fimbriiglobus sp.]